MRVPRDAAHPNLGLLGQGIEKAPGDSGATRGSFFAVKRIGINGVSEEQIMLEIPPNASFRPARRNTPRALWWPVVLAIVLGIVLDRLLYSTPVIRRIVIIRMRAAADTRA
jgi:hypothetical protein